MVAQAVLAVVGVVGMRRAEQRAHLLVVLRVLVLVAHDEADGAACRLAFEHAAEQFYVVSLLSAGGNVALARSAAVEFRLDEVKVNGDACRHAVDDTSDSLAVALAKGGQSEKFSKSVAHGVGD